MLENLVSFSHLLIYPQAALVISLILTRLCITVLPLLGYMDIPHGRHAHKKPTPRGGGIAVVMSFFAVFLLFLLNIGSQISGTTSGNSSLNFTGFCISALLIVQLGIVDDRIELPSWIKLAVQVVVAGILCVFGNGFCSIMGYELPFWVNLILTELWCIGIINAFNLIDGLDGLASGLAAVSSQCLAFWIIIMPQSNMLLAAMLLIFCASCLGFLRYNFHPAKIFLGDTGSMFIGLFFAYISMTQISASVTFVSLQLPILAIGIPIFDVFLAIWRRIVRKLSNPANRDVGIMTGDHDHLHHRILNREQSQSKTALLLYMASALFTVGAIISIMLSDFIPALTYLLFLLGIFAAIRSADIELLDSAKFVQKGLKIPHRSIFLTMIHPILDIGMILLAFFLTTHLCFSPHTKDAYSLQVFLCYIFPYILLLVGSDIYRTYWLRAGINRFFLLAKLLLFAFVVMFFASYTLYFQKIILQGLSVRDFLCGTLLFGSITFLLISSERFFIRYLESFGFRLFFLKSRMPQDMARVLIVGGGLHCRLYIQSLFCRDHMKNPFEIVGIVDDCLGLKHLNLYGFDVLGDSSNLDKLYRKYAFEKIIVTPECLKEEVKQNLERFQQDHPEVDILYFHISLNHQPQNIVNSVQAVKSEPEKQEQDLQEAKECPCDL